MCACNRTYLRDEATFDSGIVALNNSALVPNSFTDILSFCATHKIWTVWIGWVQGMETTFWFLIKLVQLAEGLLPTNTREPGFESSHLSN